MPYKYSCTVTVWAVLTKTPGSLTPHEHHFATLFDPLFLFHLAGCGVSVCVKLNLGLQETKLLLFSTAIKAYRTVCCQNDCQVKW